MTRLENANEIAKFIKDYSYKQGKILGNLIDIMEGINNELITADYDDDYYFDMYITRSYRYRKDFLKSLCVEISQEEDMFWKRLLKQYRNY